MIFRPHWLKPFLKWSKYNATPSINTKWRQTSMECFHFFEQRFPCICLNKVPIVCSTLYPVHTWLPPYKFPMIPSLSYHNICLSWSKFWGATSRNGHGIPLCLVAPEDDQLLLMLSCWCSIDVLMIFSVVSPLYTEPHEHFNSYTPG